MILQKRKGYPLLVTLCLTSVFLLLCGGNPDTNSDPDMNGDDTAMYDYVCSNARPSAEQQRPKTPRSVRVVPLLPPLIPPLFIS